MIALHVLLVSLCLVLSSTQNLEIFRLTAPTTLKDAAFSIRGGLLNSSLSQLRYHFEVASSLTLDHRRPESEHALCGLFGAFVQAVMGHPLATKSCCRSDLHDNSSPKTLGCFMATIDSGDIVYGNRSCIAKTLIMEVDRTRMISEVPLLLLNSELQQAAFEFINLIQKNWGHQAPQTFEIDTFHLALLPESLEGSPLEWRFEMLYRLGERIPAVSSLASSFSARSTFLLPLPAPSCAIEMTRVVSDTGFHPLLTTRITYAPSCCSCSSGCHVMVRELLPESVFVDPYQLSDLHINFTLSASVVDVEAPAWLSPQLLVTIASRVPTSDFFITTELPIHARYHATQNTTGFYVSTLSPPLIYFVCSGHAVFGQSTADPFVTLRIPVGNFQDDLFVGRTTSVLVSLATMSVAAFVFSR